MTDDFLGKFMGNASRAKIVRVFSIDQSGVFTLPQAAKRSGVSLRTVAKEIKALEQWGILKRGKFMITLAGVNGMKRAIGGRQKEPAWTINPAFKYLPAISKFVHEVSPVNHKSIVVGMKRAGRITVVVLSGCFMGDMSRPADIVIAADGINERRLESAIRALEPQVGREIRYAVFTTPEFKYRLTTQDRLLRETLDYPHLILLDKTKLL
ncbi:MAG: hypothetical protein Q7S50_03810 [bacterium]|nr:hypothetical protein [bacterium]